MKTCSSCIRFMPVAFAIALATTSSATTSHTWTQSDTSKNPGTSFQWHNATYWSDGSVPPINTTDGSVASVSLVNSVGRFYYLLVPGNAYGTGLGLYLDSISGGDGLEVAFYKYDSNQWNVIKHLLLLRDAAGFGGAFGIQQQSADYRGSIGCGLFLDPGDGKMTVVSNVHNFARFAVDVAGGSSATVFHTYGRGLLQVNRTTGMTPSGLDATGTLTLANGLGERAGVQVWQGTLSLPVAPTVAAPLDKACFHLDAAVGITSSESDGKQLVSQWRDADGRNLYASPNGGKPYLDTDPVSGRPVVNFGAYYRWYPTGYLGDSTRWGGAREMNVSSKTTGIREVFAVIRMNDVTNNACGHVGPSYFKSGAGGALLCTPNSSSGDGVGYRAWQGDARINGTCVRPNAPVGTRFAVVSMAASDDTDAGATLEKIGGNGTGYGGLQIGEAYFFTNLLTAAERTAVNAYLLAKWRTAEEVRELGALIVRDGATVDVPAGTSRVVDLSVEPTATSLVKTGAGTLKVDHYHGPSALTLDIRGGDIVFTGATKPAANAKPAEDPILWLDATSGSFVYDGSGKITEWRDRRDGTNYLGKSVSATSAAGATVVTSHGKTMVDTGTYSQNPSTAVKPLKLTGHGGARTFFIVYEKSNDSAVVLTDSASNPSIACSGGTASKLINEVGDTEPAGALWQYDGAPVDPVDVANTKSEMHVLSFATENSFQADLLGGMASGYFCGGLRVAEVLYYDRVLSTQERLDTEAYLYDRWKDEAHPATVVPTIVKTTVGGVSTCRLMTDSAVTTLDPEDGLGDIVAAQGSVAVAMTSPFLTAAAQHYDASRSNSFVWAADADTGKPYVTRWNGRRSTDPYASATVGATATKPTVLEVAINGTGPTMPVVDFGPTGSPSADLGGPAAMYWSTGGYYPIREFHFVQADMTQNVDSKRSPLLGMQGDGSEAGNQWPFLRDGSAIMHTYGSYPLIHGYIGVNAEDPSVANQTRAFEPELERFYQYTFVPTSTVYNVAAFATRNGGSTSGGQRLGEVLAYAATNSIVHRGMIQKYLQRKWLGLGEGNVAAAGRIAVTAGSTLSLSTTDTVYRAIAPTSLEVPFVSGDSVPLTVAGGLHFGASGSVTVNAAASLGYGRYVLATADSITGASNLSKWSLVVPQGYRGRAKVRVEGPELVLNVVPRGLMVIVR